MKNNAILLDTSFLLALWNRRDNHHSEALDFAATIREELIIPAPVLVELFQLLIVRANYDAAIRGFEKTQSEAFRIEVLTTVDMARMAEIMNKYADNELDYADIAIIAIAERLNISAICTFDKLDFLRFSPKHTDYLTILP